VARVGILTGDASIKRGDSTDWQAAAVNAPLMTGDEISVGAGSRAELQLDAAHFLRVSGDTDLRLADLENGHYQVQVSHGTVTWRVLRASQAQAEIDTPLVGVHPGALSTVRVEVEADGQSHITVRHGEADVSTQKGSEKVTENSTMDVRGVVTDPEFQVVVAGARDDFDGWSDQRDAYLQRAQAPRYTPPEVTGVEDLDAYGHWVFDPAYGWVWAPTVAPTWAPYQNGQWVWEDYYGWTWVDYAPWGWAPFHYGYWYNRVGYGWAWFPGPRVGRAFWRPAMVGFFGFGGVGVGFGFGNIGWIPLAPYEAFRPWYGRGGFVGVNVVGNANILGTFRNASVAGGVTAVTAADFQRSNFRSTVAVDRATLARASLVRGSVPVTPTSQNLRFSNRAATVQGTRAAAGVSNTRFYGNAGASSSARTAGFQRTPFTQQQAAVRSAVSAPGGMQASAAVQAAKPGQTVGATNRAAGPAGGWQRFEGSQPGNPAGGGAAPVNRYSNSGTPANGSANSAPRQFQVSPSIIRQRSDTTPAVQAAPARQAPAAPAGGYGGGASAGRSAAPSRSSSHGGGKR